MIHLLLIHTKQLSKLFKKKCILIFKFAFPLLMFFSLICCERISNDEKTSIQWKKSEYKNSFIEFDDKGKVNFFDDFPLHKNQLIGKLHFNKNVVYFKSENNKNLEFKLFDFNLLQDECVKINYSKNKKTYKKYFLCNQDIFYDKGKNDTIYKFCFKYYNVLLPKSSLVLFVGKKSGILGNYLIEHSENDGISVSERMFGEVYRERYHYENFSHFTIK